MITNPFEESVNVSLFTSVNDVDPQQQLDIDKDVILSKLGCDKDYFLSWLCTVSIKHISNLKLETLKLLVDCWLGSKNKYSIK